VGRERGRRGRRPHRDAPRRARARARLQRLPQPHHATARDGVPQQQRRYLGALGARTWPLMRPMAIRQSLRPGRSPLRALDHGRPQAPHLAAQRRPPVREWRHRSYPARCGAALRALEQPGELRRARPAQWRAARSARARSRFAPLPDSGSARRPADPLGQPEGLRVMVTSAGTPSSLLRTLDSIAREAAVLILEVYATKFSVDFKAPRDPVTEADRRANELICDRLSKLFPNVPIVAEESEPETFAEYRKAERIFFVDPLDGTREFVARNGEFVVMIGYVEGDRPAAAVIHAPESGISWLGEVGSGAYQIDPQGAEKPITVSNLGALGARELVALGSAGLKASVVAHGAADAYVAPHYAGKRWDACAAEALIN